MLREVWPSPPPTAVVSKPRKPECLVMVQKLPLRPSTIYQVAEDGTLSPKGKTSDRPVSMAHLQRCCQVVSTSVNKAMEPIVQWTVQEKEEKDLIISLLKDLKKSNDQLLPYLQKMDKKCHYSSNNQPRRKKTQGGAINTIPRALRFFFLSAASWRLSEDKTRGGGGGGGGGGWGWGGGGWWWRGVVVVVVVVGVLRILSVLLQS